MSEFLTRFEKLAGLLLSALFFYWIARLEFLIWNWGQFQSKDLRDLVWAFFVGFRFDVSAVCMTLIPTVLLSFAPWPSRFHRHWQKVAFWLYTPLGLLFFLMNLGDSEFVNFVGRRFTYDGLFIVSEISGKLGGIFVTYWLLFSLNIALMALFVFVSWKILHRNIQRKWHSHRGSEALAYAFAVVLVLIIVVIGVRGGLQKKPVNIVNSHIFVAPILNNLVLNSTFTFLKSYGAETLSNETYFSDREKMLSYLNGAGKGPSLLETRRPNHPQNVVIIILESFGLEYMGAVHGDQGYTPFLDSLAKKGLFFKNSYANARRSIEGVAAVLAGIPALMSEPFISSHFATNYFVGLGSLLSNHNYQTSFFHGGNNGTMYFDSFAKSAGFEKYYGANEYPNADDNDGTWGIYDEPFLRFMGQKLSESPQPLVAGFFSLSSHNPYKIPDQYKGRFPKGPLEILESIGYADYSLQKFFEEAATQPWYKDTLFVITADHTSLSFRPGYENELSRYKVPILFYHPTYKWPQGIDANQVVQQIDILPSILDFLGRENKETNYLGRSIFIPGERTATLHIDGRYFLVAKDYFLDWLKGKDINMYDQLDLNQKAPLSEPRERKQELENRLKASVQYFNEAMWDNRLYYPSGK
ncbi:MAG: LTA synthase family protein [Bdellovibrionaceae bacterium]|nr:LTA synthase family protein [Pseudobdellovibrionaceae bacterium]